ncbi:hypothetical protein [Moorena sp. SIO4G3]|uniref:hypothetical protein n=1 Tax=Moorena sp. SIO4G3 TaxID=2607821 RepID=UPI00142AD20D|nr:hypothetical protein [Moorena sp. SIO4G3]NEO79656.1 hypothetical protein [Moorena sp. SIO4G3]
MSTICANSDLFVELNQTDAETISGGYEVFTIKNKTKYNLYYTVDGKLWKHKPNQTWVWTAYKGGTIKFDEDIRSGVINYKKYNLANGGVYGFYNNTKTKGNPYDVDLYDIG